MIKILSCKDIAKVNPSSLRRFLVRRAKQLFEDRTWHPDREGYLVVVEAQDDIYTDFPLVGKRGLVSDVFDVASPSNDAFGSPFEMVSHHSFYGFYEAYLQCNDDVGVCYIIPDEIADKHADLQQVLTTLIAPLPDADLSIEQAGC